MSLRHGLFLCPASGRRGAGRRRKAGTGEEWLAGPAGFGRGGMRVRGEGARRVSGRDARGRDAVSQGIRSQIHADRLPVLCRAADNEGAGRRGRILFRRAELSALRAFLGEGEDRQAGEGRFRRLLFVGMDRAPPSGDAKRRERAETRGGRGQEPSFCRAGKIFDRAPDVFFRRRRSVFSCPGPVIRAFWRFVIYFLRRVLQAAPVGEGQTLLFCVVYARSSSRQVGMRPERNGERAFLDRPRLAQNKNVAVFSSFINLFFT